MTTNQHEDQPLGDWWDSSEAMRESFTEDGRWNAQWADAAYLNQLEREVRELREKAAAVSAAMKEHEECECEDDDALWFALKSAGFDALETPAEQEGQSK